MGGISNPHLIDVVASKRNVHTQMSDAYFILRRKLTCSAKFFRWPKNKENAKLVRVQLYLHPSAEPLQT